MVISLISLVVSLVICFSIIKSIFSSKEIFAAKNKGITPTMSRKKFFISSLKQILEELNIKKIEFIARDAELVSYIVKPNLPKIGKIYGKLIPDIKRALENTNTNIIATRVANGESFEVECNGKKLNFEPDDVLIETKSAEGYSCGEEGGFLTAIDTKLTEALIKEGIARELVRSVQETRKKSGFDVSDRIILGISGSEIVESVIDDYRDYIMNETLATEWQVGIKNPIVNEANTLDDASWLIEIKK